MKTYNANASYLYPLQELLLRVMTVICIYGPQFAESEAAVKKLYTKTLLYHPSAFVIRCEHSNCDVLNTFQLDGLKISHDCIYSIYLGEPSKFPTVG